MKYDPATRHRRSIRLKGFNYARPGAHFITVCTRNRECLFGRIVADSMQSNLAGAMLAEALIALPERFPSALLDTFVVMPNHVHWIIVVGSPPQSNTSTVGISLAGTPRLRTIASKTADRATTRVAPTVGDMVGAFRSLTTVRYVHGVRTMSWPAISGRLWQRNYYEHAIRGDEEMNRTRDYIETNPARWTQDMENPFRVEGAGNGEEDEYPWNRDAPVA